MKNLTDIFLKARSGVYKDTSENRRLHRVGQKYGESKQPEDDEKDKKKGDEDFEEAIEKFSEMFYDGESSEKLKRYLDSRLGEGTYDRISKETSSRQFEESSERKDYFMGKVEDAFLNKKAQSVNPAKELEAVNKVIEAINNKKMTLPPDQIMVLIEKKNKLELAKKQAEKINAGVKANEEKRNVKEVKETNKKINEASKRKKKYGDMNVEEAKKELLGKDLTITDIETGKTRTEKITSILEGNVRGHETVMARVEGGGTYPIKHIDTGKEWKAWKLNLNSSSKETKSEQVKQEKEKVDFKELMNVDADFNRGDLKLLDDASLNELKEKLLEKYNEESNYERRAFSRHGYFTANPKSSKYRRRIEAVEDELSKRGETKEEAIQRVNEKYKRLSKDHSDYISRFGAAVGPDLAELQRAKRIELQKIEDRFAEKEKQVSSLKEDLDHHNNELDNLENKKEDYIKQHGEEKYNERHKKIEDKIEDTRKELDNLKGSDKTGGNEEKETYTRVKFDDLPNSGKVNLKKYLSDKVKRIADENLGILSKVSTENLKKMEAGLVKEFNSQFDDLPKSRRAEKLYSIMKVKAELAQRGSETKNGENNSNKNIKKAVEEVSANFENLADEVDKNGWNMQYIKYGDIDSFDFDEKDSTLTVHATGKGYGNTKPTKTELT